MNMKFTKLVGTVGPSSRNYDMIKDFILSGINVIRINFSHGTFEEHKKTIEFVRRAAEEVDEPVAIFQDLQGPKIRLGNIKDDAAEVQAGETFIITTENCTGNAKKASIDYPFLHEEVSPGNSILIDDGLISLRVKSINGKEIQTTVENSGIIKSRKGVNLPNISLKHIDSFTKKDKKDLDFAFKYDLEYIALSFVRTAQDIRNLRSYMLKTYGKTIPIIAKIEKPQALDDIDNIIETADSIMVARGDLGVETSPQQVPIIQKNIIRTCNLKGKPVITATQMLESMINNPRPTRAEAADVANAILDGTSAIMLSGETAAGSYPREAVHMMYHIAYETEQSLHFKRIVTNQKLTLEEFTEGRKKQAAEAVGMGALELANQVQARYIACFTHSGGTARLISKHRPHMPIVALSPIAATVRRLALSWGVIPLQLAEVDNIDDLFTGAPKLLKSRQLIAQGDCIVITAGVPVGTPGKTNMIKVTEID